MAKANVSRHNEKRPAVRRRRPAGIATPSAFLAELATQDQARRMMRYEVIGRLIALQTTQGSIEFPRESGPGIGVEADREGFLFVTPWPVLPELKEHSEAFCSQCLQKCDICDGRGEGLCIFTGCGGAGKRAVGQDGCPECMQRGVYALDCGTCRGSGNVTILADCPACKGSGRAPCGPCRGSGKRPSGLDQEGKTCAGCRGTLRGGEWKRQDLHSLIAGKVGSHIAIGPVVRLAVKLPTHHLSKGQAPMRYMEFSPADKLMVLLPIDKGVNPPAYFWRQT